MFLISDVSACTTGGVSKKCVFPFNYKGMRYNKCTSNSKPWCATMTDANGNYIRGNWGYCGECKNIAPVDCQWSAWSWGTCSKSCGGGTQTGSRTISQQALNGGKACTGDSTTTQGCNAHSCSSGEPYTQEICSALTMTYIFIIF